MSEAQSVQEVIHDRNKKLEALKADTEAQCIKMEIRLYTIARLLFKEIKNDYADGFLFDHQHAEEDPNPC
ncbi:hypothetical protein FRC01_007818, partial [Tulasnella sp. 417]